MVKEVGMLASTLLPPAARSLYGLVKAVGMTAERRYVTDIPKDARAVVPKDQPDHALRRVEYYVGDELVGVRHYEENGSLCSESPFRGGGLHGRVYTWYETGELMAVQTYDSGLEHGTAYQWRPDGTIIGTYTMDRGNGLDLWWQEWAEGDWLSEARYYVDGLPHGFEWWLSGDGTLSRETHWRRGELHGIERQWNAKERLSRGYPQCYVDGERVTKRQYERACKTDPTLPSWRAEDNLPRRDFPPEVARHLRPCST